MNKIKIKFIIALFISSFIVICAFGANNAAAFEDEKPSKIKINMGLFNEFYKLINDSFTGVKFEGEIKQIVNGAYMESKFIGYSKDLNYKRVDVISYGDKFSHVTTPDKVWYYFEKENYVIYYANKKNVARFNSKVYFDSVKDDGKITKTNSDGDIVYKLIDYNYNIKQTFVFEGATKKLIHQIVEPAGAEKIETSYKSIEKTNISKDIFSFPSRAKSKSMDQSARPLSRTLRMGAAPYSGKVYR